MRLNHTISVGKLGEGRLGMKLVKCVVKQFPLEGMF